MPAFERIKYHLANCIEYFQGRKTEGFEEESVALKRKLRE
jgi:hypothetical protein